MPTSLLLVEDDPSMAAICRAYLERQDYDISLATTGQQALEILDAELPDLVLLDLNLPDMNGTQILKQINDKQYPVEVIVVTGDGSINTAVETMQLGARDFIVKPFSKDRLLTTLNNCVEHSRLSSLVATYQQDLDRHQFAGFVGSSLSMQTVYRVIDSAANTKATAFITGESGTGKEVCAEAIHQQSNRAKGPFIALNCGAIPKDLIESEIFGHIKGAFTGALKDRLGAAQQADGGTLFLDEVCEMELDLQPKLLRFLQTGRFQPVGGSSEESVDVRILCATNKQPLEEVNNGRFREDLYYRLHVLPIHLPPLRDRNEDILEIGNHFLQQYAAEEGKNLQRFSVEVESVLASYDWPGNVRQLQNVVRNIVVLHDGDVVLHSMLPAPLDQQLDTQPRINHPAAQLPHNIETANAEHPMGIRPMAELEREAIEQAVAACDGNIPQAAHHLGISAATIYRKKSAWKQLA